MIFFTADEHYGHDNIRKYCGRPFATSDDPCIKCHYRLDKTGVGYCYKCIEMAAVEREERK